MIEQVSQSDFISRFAQMNRENQFTYEGKVALYDYLEECKDDTGQEVELDVIALCCEYTEYENIDEFRKEQEGYKGTSEDYEGEYIDFEAIREHTTLISVGTDSFIIQQF